MRVPEGRSVRRAWRLAGTALVVASALAAVPPSSGADGHSRAPSPSAHPTYVVHLDRDTATPAGDTSRTSSRSIRSWPGKKIRYWADLPQSYQWSLQAALRSWNATGLDMTFVRAPKSRAGCHFAAAIGLRSLLEDFAPTIPDWALDQHTLNGMAMGRGLDHFRREGAKLVPEPTEPDPFIEEAYRLWALKQRGK